MQKKNPSRNHVLVLFNPLIGPLLGPTTPGLSGPGSNGNKGVHRISQTSSITDTSQSGCLESYPGHSLVWDSYPSAEKKSVYSTALAEWAISCSVNLFYGISACRGYLMSKLSLKNVVFLDKFELTEIDR